ncbi:uncharacterized protein LOC108909846 [Anoplophora glabripennis]|uniref:uncharacterized protein LOC108909846 n=1 Tax=Anoplophora glabripennis TaxID=217634 RepID=UPI000874CA74|nr:uncharacterized protein LOC108909846 [Anoplophora glabripennis]
MLLPLALVFAFLASVLVENDASVDQWVYNPRSDYVQNTEHLRDNCCIIPTCDDSGHCYETLSCGYICSHGRYRPATNYGFTPGYRLKEYYTKEDCRFGECKMYKFLCSHCPSPKERDFNIYTVRKDCKNCYSYM